MKIDYKNYPILEKLEKELLGTIPFYEVDMAVLNTEIVPFFVKEWKLNAKEFKKEINVISKSFREASLKAKEKLSELIIDISTNDLSDILIKGTYIIGDFVHIINITHIKGSEDYNTLFYTFDRTGIPILMCNFNSDNFMVWGSRGYFKNENELSLAYKSTIGEIIIFSMFKKYAEVETKILRPHQKPREISCLYRNNTKMNLTFLDSKWFTTLVKSDAFKVNGHFRLQPCKIDDEWTKKIIWISDFMKSGYTSHAKILSQ